MFEVGVMFWAGDDPAATLAELTAMDARRGQMGIPGNLDLNCAAAWKAAIAEASFRVDTVFAAFDGEDYADIPTVERTVGFVPQNTRDERERRMMAVSDFAAELGVGGIATHIGFVSQNSREVRDLVLRVCDFAAVHSQTFALETGQETAHDLRRFVQDADRENLGINFDPANMILYGTGDPIEALGVLGPHVLSVHAKDGDWPEKGVPGALGRERPLGQGSVGVERFLAKLREIGYAGPVFVEREGVPPAQRLLDTGRGVALLRGILSSRLE